MVTSCLSWIKMHSIQIFNIPANVNIKKTRENNSFSQINIKKIFWTFRLFINWYWKTRLITNYCPILITYLLWKYYCLWGTNFHGWARPRNLVSNEKEIPIDVYTEYLKTTNSRIHKLAFLSQNIFLALSNVRKGMYKMYQG